MAKDKGPYRAKPKLKDRFYKTLIVYDAVKSVGPKTLRPMVMYQAPDHPLDKEEEVFRRFVDKIAQFCDCRKGGSTVTSIAVLGASIPLYVLASNKRNQKEDRAVTSFVSDMLRQVRELGERGSGNGSWTAQHDHLLEYVIAFNSQRVADLIKMVGEAAGLSLNALANDDSPGGERYQFSLREVSCFSSDNP